MLICVVVVASLCTGLMVGYDIFRDRQNIIATEAPIPAYTDWKPYPGKDQTPLFVLPANARVRAKRIRYGKDYMAVRVQDEEGRSGWIFSGYSFRLKKAG